MQVYTMVRLDEDADKVIEIVSVHWTQADAVRAEAVYQEKLQHLANLQTDIVPTDFPDVHYVGGTARHTAGPWVVNLDVLTGDGSGSLRGHVAIDAPTHGALAQVAWQMEHDDEPNLELRSNARLVAAAPDLLQALQELLALTDDHNNDAAPEESTFAFARQAIAKATGAAA